MAIKEEIGALGRKYGILLIPFCTMLALLRVSPMMFDGWSGLSAYLNSGGLINWARHVGVVMWKTANGRATATFISGLLEVFISEIPLDVTAAAIITGILYCVCRLFSIKHIRFVALLYTVFLVFTPYPIRVAVVQIALLQFWAPVLFLLVLLLLLKKYEETGNRRYIWVLYPLNAAACTWMENTSVAYGLVLALYCLAAWCRERRPCKLLLGSAAVALVSGLYMMLSPGLRGNRSENGRISGLVELSAERFAAHGAALFHDFVWCGSMAALLISLTLLVCGAAACLSQKDRRGLAAKGVLLLCTLASCAAFLRFSLTSGQFGYTQEFIMEPFYTMVDEQYAFLLLLFAALVLCGPLWLAVLGRFNKWSGACLLYGVVLVIVVLPTGQIASRIYSPLYLMIVILSCVASDACLQSVSSVCGQRVCRIAVFLFCVLALDFQVQLCLRIGRVQKEREQRIQTIREQVLTGTEKDEYVLPAFSERDACLGGVVRPQDFHYDIFLERYGLPPDMNIIFAANDFAYLKQKKQQDSCIVDVVNRYPGQWTCTYRLYYRAPSAQWDTLCAEEERPEASAYFISAVKGTGEYRLSVRLTDAQTGKTLLLAPDAKVYLEAEAEG